MSEAKILSFLSGPWLGSEVREALAAWDNPDPAVVDQTIVWVERLRDDLCTLVATIHDDDDLRMTLAIQYIELKSRWIALNTKINYSVFASGACDPADAFRGTAVTSLLARVESLLDQNDIDQITEFLAKPIREAA